MWSPDGKRIAFVSNRDGNDEVYVMNANGSGQRNISNDGAQDNSPAWSPDSSQIAFVSKRDGSKEVYVVSADGSGSAKRLTTAPDKLSDNYDPIWAPK